MPFFGFWQHVVLLQPTVVSRGLPKDKVRRALREEHLSWLLELWFLRSSGYAVHVDCVVEQRNLCTDLDDGHGWVSSSEMGFGVFGDDVGRW